MCHNITAPSSTRSERSTFGGSALSATKETQTQRPFLLQNISK